MSKAYAGSFSFYRQRKPSARWKVQGVPECDPSWVVVINMPGSSSDKRMRSFLPICEDCQKCAGNPVLDRPNCSCIKAVEKWAKEELQTRTLLMQQGKIQELQAMRAPQKWATPQKVIEIYKERGPKDRKQRCNSLKAIYEQGTGRALEEMVWSDLTEDLVLNWAEMRQEAGRRGWLGLWDVRKMPENGWEVLRGLKAEGKLQALDKRTAMACNTSILGYLTQAKTIFGQEARQNFLRGMNIPELKSFLEMTLKLPKPVGHKKIAANRWVTMLETESEWKTKDLKVWVIHELLLRLSCRPKEVLSAKPHWLETVQHEGKDRTRIMIINRPEEGFTLKAGSGATERAIWLPHELVAAIEEVSTPESLIGAKHKTEALELLSVHSKWMRQFVPKGSTQTNYLLRHSGAAERMTSEDSTQAAALLGHKTTQMVETTYGQVLNTLEPISDDEILRRVA